MTSFSNETIKMDVLKKRAFNLRWAEVPDGVIPLTAADSDFPVAPEVVEAICDYAKEGYFSYTPKTGFPEFKQSLANALWSRKPERIDPNLILPVDSAARGMEIIAKAILKPGDDAIVFDPVDFLFRTSMSVAGANIILFPSKIKDGRLDLSGLEDYITPHTKMIGLCNPHNPLGLLYTDDDLQYLLELSDKYAIHIMNDEVWSDIVYPGETFNSIVRFGAERNKRTLSVFGFSKSFGIAGLRVGCVYCTDEQLYNKIVDASLVNTTIGGISSLSQVAGMACLDRGYYWLDAFMEQMKRNRDYALARIEKMPGISCHVPSATFVLFPDITETAIDPEDFVRIVRERYRLAIVPGGAKFFGPGSAGHIRICLATSHEILEEGLNRLERALNDFATMTNR